MAKIYSNAAITIAAVSSNDCHAGLHRRETPTFYTHELNLALSPSKNMCWISEHIKDTKPTHLTRVIAQIRTAEWYDKSVSLFQEQLPPLANRAWFFQEWQLSPRILHFDYGQLVWQCGYGYLTQWRATIGQDFVSPEAKQRHLAPGSLKRATKLQKIAARLRILKPIDQKTGAYHRFPISDWQTTVSRFSNLGLTFHRDKLPAISGVVKHTKQFQRGDFYAAGLWLEDMPWDLAWIVQDGTMLPRPEDFAGPSWSWISVYGRVSFAYGQPRNPNARNAGDLITNCSISNVRCVPVGHDPTGALKSARLTIWGLADPCELRYDDISPASDNTAPRYRLFEDDREQELHVVFNPDYALAEPGRDCIAPNTPLYCLWIFEVGRPELVTVGLVLRKSRHVAKAFERIGIVRKDSDRWSSSEFFDKIHKYIIV